MNWHLRHIQCKGSLALRLDLVSKMDLYHFYWKFVFSDQNQVET
jgi:hypothetical protein